MHISDDKLLQYALEIIDDDSERAEVQTHLDACQSCRSRLDTLRNDIDVIGSVRPQRATRVSPSRPRWPVTAFSLLRAAALVVFGLAAGYGMATWGHHEPARVSSHYMALSPAADSISRYAASDATEVSADYYRGVLGGTP